jgi:molybdopterin molybdotransferase
VRLLRHGGELWADPVLGKSGLINTMVHADGIVEIGKDIEGLEEGTRADVILF